MRRRRSPRQNPSRRRSPRNTKSPQRKKLRSTARPERSDNCCTGPVQVASSGSGAAPMLGQRFGNYRIEGTLGEGGMGVVYRARDLRLDRPVAIKVLAPAALSDTNQRKRFFSEAKTASALNHPNIITIYEINDIDGMDYIAMECVQGKTAKEPIE